MTKLHAPFSASFCRRRRLSITYTCERVQIIPRQRTFGGEEFGDESPPIDVWASLNWLEWMRRMDGDRDRWRAPHLPDSFCGVPNQRNAYIDLCWANVSAKIREYFARSQTARALLVLCAASSVWWARNFDIKKGEDDQIALQLSRDCKYFSTCAAVSGGWRTTLPGAVTGTDDTRTGCGADGSLINWRSLLRSLWPGGNFGWRIFKAFT